METKKFYISSDSWDGAFENEYKARKEISPESIIQVDEDGLKEQLLVFLGYEHKYLLDMLTGGDIEEIKKPMSMWKLNRIIYDILDRNDYALDGGLEENMFVTFALKTYALIKSDADIYRIIESYENWAESY